MDAEMKQNLLGRPSAFAIVACAVSALALSASAHGLRSHSEIEAAAFAAVRDGPGLDLLTDPTPTLDMLAADPVARAIRAEADASRLVGRALPHVPTAPDAAAPLDPLIAAKVASTFAAFSEPGATRPAAPVQAFSFQRYLSRAARAPRTRRASSRSSTPAAHVQFAIQAAAERSGVSHGYLWRAAKRESSFDPSARAATSTAAGLYQFIETTWLLTVRRHGASYGLGHLASQIHLDRNGEPFVNDRVVRRQILALRYDAQLSAYLAGEFTRENASALRSYLRRPPRDGELYMAHFLGSGGAVSLLRANAHDPARSAAELFPRAASANPSLFYAGGRPRSVASLRMLLISKGEAA